MAELDGRGRIARLYTVTVEARHGGGGALQGEAVEAFDAVAVVGEASGRQRELRQRAALGRSRSGGAEEHGECDEYN